MRCGNSFDALGDRDFSFAREEGNAPYLLEIGFQDGPGANSPSPLATAVAPFRALFDAGHQMGPTISVIRKD